MIVAFIKTIIGIVLFAVMSGSVASILFENEDERTNLELKKLSVICLIGLLVCLI